MSPAAAAHHSVFKDSSRNLAGALFGEARATATIEEPASVHIICVDDDTSAFLSDLLAVDGVTRTIHPDHGAFARSDGFHLASCLIVDASAFEPANRETNLRALCAQLPTIMIAGPDDLRAAVQAMKMGAIDFLESPLDRCEVASAVNAAVGAGRAWRQWNFCCVELHSRFSSLTPRERQVLELVAQGRLNKQIAWSLGLSEITVKAHRGSVMRKMGARSLADLVRMADALVEVREEPMASSEPRQSAAA